MTEAAAPPQRKALNPMLKLALELGPLALFFAAYSRLGIFAATAVLMACVMVTLAVSYAMLKRIPDHAAGDGGHRPHLRLADPHLS